MSRIDARRSPSGSLGWVLVRECSECWFAVVRPRRISCGYWLSSGDTLRVSNEYWLAGVTTSSYIVWTLIEFGRYSSRIKWILIKVFEKWWPLYTGYDSGLRSSILRNGNELLSKLFWYNSGCQMWGYIWWPFISKVMEGHRIFLILFLSATATFGLFLDE